MKTKRYLHVSSSLENDVIVPFIRIRGKWLRDFGFDIGDKYEVDASFNKLVITNKENDTIDDCVSDEGKSNNTNENSLEDKVNNTQHSYHRTSYYGNDYKGYTVHLKLERDMRLKPVQLYSSAQAYAFLKSLEEKSREVMLSVMLDRGNKVLGVYEAAKGGITGTSVYPSEVFKTALMTNSTAIILAHNHPSGDPTPSAEDKKLTDDMLKAAKILNMQIMDHIIIGHNDYYSLADSGYMRKNA